MSVGETLKWTFGLRASNGKYLTAETFGNQINVSGQFLRKKQVFTLEQNPGSQVVYLVTPNNKYLGATEKGAILTDGESKGKNEEWTVMPQSDGRWAFKSAHGYFLTGSDTVFSAFGREIGETEKWTIHLAMHPQVAIRNVNRKSYVHLEGSELNTNEAIPWGHDSLVTFEFYNGKYKLRASNNKFLDKSGKLVDTVSDDSLFVIEFFESQIALKANDGKYLQGYGPKGTLQARRTQVGKDELFELEDSQPNVTLASSAGKFWSNRQSDDTKANQLDVEDTEIFQMEIVGTKWAFRNHKNKFLTTADASVVKASGTTRGETELFDIVWLGAQAALKASNGKFVATKPNGTLVASLDEPDDTAKFTLTIINRPQLVLRCEYGFVATKAKDVIQCNGAEHEVFAVESKNGAYAFKSANGKYWKVEGDGSIVANSAAPDYFYFEFLQHSRFAIKHVATEKYIKGEHQGNFKATSTTVGKDELWEY